MENTQIGKKLGVKEHATLNKLPLTDYEFYQNFFNNHITDRTRLFCGTIEAIKDYQFDLIMVNINRSIIVEALSKINRCLKPSGLAIFSGILVEEKNILKPT